MDFSGDGIALQRHAFRAFKLQPEWEILLQRCLLL